MDRSQKMYKLGSELKTVVVHISVPLSLASQMTHCILHMCYWFDLSLCILELITARGRGLVLTKH